MSDDITITVAADSLEAAIYGTRKGERWETETGVVLQIKYGMAVACADALYNHPRLSCWHRVEELLLCPACGAKMGIWDCLDHRKCVWCDCGVSGPRKESESAAREAWRKMMGGGR